MTRPVFDLELARGDDYNPDPFAWHDENGDPIDLTGRTYQAQIRTTPNALVAYPFTITVDADAGVVALSMTSAITATIPAGQNCWDLEQTIDGRTTTPFGGKVTVSPDVTR